MNETVLSPVKLRTELWTANWKFSGFKDDATCTRVEGERRPNLDLKA